MNFGTCHRQWRYGLLGLFVVVFVVGSGAQVASAQPKKPGGPYGLGGMSRSQDKRKPAMGVVNFLTEDGVNIEADYYRPTGSNANDVLPVVILSHMYPATRSSWKPLAELLAQGGFAVLAYDIRGAGGSTFHADKDLAKLYQDRNHDHFASAWKDVAAARKWMSEQSDCDATRIILGGASVGCSIVLDSTARDSTGIAGIFCLSPGVDYMGIDSIEHIKKCKDLRILLVAPEGEYAAVEKLVEATGGKARGKSVKGGSESHGTKMFDAEYGASMQAKLVKFAKAAVDAAKEKADGADGDKKKDDGKSKGDSDKGTSGKDGATKDGKAS